MVDARLQIDNPSPALAGAGIAAAARRAFLATRPPFFIASAMPVAIGTAWAGASYHRFDGSLFGLSLAATVLAHAAANVYNDVGDDVIGADAGNTNRIYPYTGGSRFIQTGLLSRAQMTQLRALRHTHRRSIDGMRPRLAAADPARADVRQQRLRVGEV